MLYQKNLSPEISEELFENPGSEYRGAPFWSWNCRVTKKLIRDQIEVFHKMGFGGAHIHPRTGLETEYMSRRFLELVSLDFRFFYSEEYSSLPQVAGNI